jgi:hypothetical protein
MQNVNLNGMDAGGITRNIARDRKPRKLLAEGRTSDRSWTWVVKSLVKKGGNTASQCNVNMLDTILCRSGMPEAWYFTSRGGTIMKKQDRNLTKKATLQRWVGNLCVCVRVWVRACGMMFWEIEGATAVIFMVHQLYHLAPSSSVQLCESGFPFAQFR